MIVIHRGDAGSRAVVRIVVGDVVPVELELAVVEVPVRVVREDLRQIGARSVRYLSCTTVACTRFSSP